MKATGLDAELHGYLAARRTPDDALLDELRNETQERSGDAARMQIAPEQGTFLRILVAAIGARRVLEVGTFTGYSALSMARGMADGGQLLTLDVDADTTAVAQRYWQRAGVADRIELKLAPALETLGALPLVPTFDFAFVDALKSEYDAYYEQILPRLQSGGLIAVDNVLWGGRIIDDEDQEPDTLAIRAFNDKVAGDDRVDSVMLALSDGLTVMRKR